MGTRLSFGRHKEDDAAGIRSYSSEANSRNAKGEMENQCEKYEKTSKPTEFGFRIEHLSDDLQRVVSNRCGTRKNLLTKKMKVARLQFAREYANFTLEDWKRKRFCCGWPSANVGSATPYFLKVAWR
ncbi:hypothetical protein QE152_g30966 [Popillia japonica]|uniref:Transposase Tc1-like domain-containing protein n=1 Tax=Popillia japonica TaxID=7064 RepID=A0AAW1JCK4_POPJA